MPDYYLDRSSLHDHHHPRTIAIIMSTRQQNGRHRNNNKTLPRVANDAQITINTFLSLLHNYHRHIIGYKTIDTVQINSLAERLERTKTKRTCLENCQLQFVKCDIIFPQRASQPLCVLRKRRKLSDKDCRE